MIKTLRDWWAVILLIFLLGYMAGNWNIIMMFLQFVVQYFNPQPPVKLII